MGWVSSVPRSEQSRSSSVRWRIWWGWRVLGWRCRASGGFVDESTGRPRHRRSVHSPGVQLPTPGRRTPHWNPRGDAADDPALHPPATSRDAAGSVEVSGDRSRMMSSSWLGARGSGVTPDRKRPRWPLRSATTSSATSRLSSLPGLNAEALSTRPSVRTTRRAAPPEAGQPSGGRNSAMFLPRHGVARTKLRTTMPR